MQHRVLIADDDPDMLSALESALLVRDFSVLTARDGEAARSLIEKEPLDLVLLDVQMPRCDGLTLTASLKKDPALRFLPVILITARNSVEEISEGLASGADDYLCKPYRREELYARIDAVLRARELYRQLEAATQLNRELQRQIESLSRYADLVGESAAMRRVFTLIEQVAEAEVPVLITGESGTGKELVARALHSRSLRASGPFIAQNCSSFQENILESELFGHSRGAFTGADRDKAGLFELADGGTFFLDEVGELSPSSQAKLLRVLQEGTFYRLGETVERRADVRIVAATNRDLRVMGSRGTFREDLFFRLNVFSVELPPLRERLEDVPLLVEHFLARARKGGKSDLRRVTDEVLQAFRAYPWPGNVRELENELRRLIVLGKGRELIGREALSPHIAAALERRVTTARGSLHAAVAALELSMIEAALDQHGGNVSRAAKQLGISRTTLLKKRKDAATVAARGELPLT